MPSIAWDVEVLDRTAELIDYTALHYYWGPRGDDPYYGTLAGAYDFERYLVAVEGLIESVRRDRRIAKPIWIGIDEWNVSYHTGDHGLLYTLRDALADALFIHMMQRHCNTVKMGNLAQMVNVIPAIVAGPEGMFRQSIYWPLWLAANVCGRTLVDCWTEVETWTVDLIPDRSFPYLNAVATLDEPGERIILSVVNCHVSQDIEAAVTVLGAQTTDDAFVRTLNADSPDAHNSFENPEAVRLEAHETLGGNSISYNFPAHSQTVLEFEIV
jgi:alpha-N-arabinofuranosidase